MEKKKNQSLVYYNSLLKISLVKKKNQASEFGNNHNIMNQCAIYNNIDILKRTSILICKNN